MPVVVAGTLPLWLASGLYFWQAAEFLRVGNYCMAAAFLGYAAANFGFIYAATRGAA